MTGLTGSGFQFELDDELLDDYELLELLSDIDNGDYQKTTRMVNMLLGDDQVKRLKDHLRNEKGRVSSKAMMEEVGKIFEVCNQKNS